jgi:cystathionine beta-lyase/cystathionine gamma-synthase
MHGWCCAACARFRRGCRCTSGTRWKWRTGSKRGPRWRPCSALRCRSTRVTSIWKRDCRGTNGLLSFELQPGIANAAVERFVDALSLFGRGSSWGGYESLVAWTDMRAARSVTDWSRRGAVVRLHVGLEAPSDLLRDLECGFAALGAG